MSRTDLDTPPTDLPRRTATLVEATYSTLKKSPPPELPERKYLNNPEELQRLRNEIAQNNPKLKRPEEIEEDHEEAAEYAAKRNLMTSQSAAHAAAFTSPQKNTEETSAKDSLLTTQLRAALSQIPEASESDKVATDNLAEVLENLAAEIAQRSEDLENAEAKLASARKKLRLPGHQHKKEKLEIDQRQERLSSAIKAAAGVSLAVKDYYDADIEAADAALAPLRLHVYEACLNDLQRPRHPKDSYEKNAQGALTLKEGGFVSRAVANIAAAAEVLVYKDNKALKVEAGTVGISEEYIAAAVELAQAQTLESLQTKAARSLPRESLPAVKRLSELEDSEVNGLEETGANSPSRAATPAPALPPRRNLMPNKGQSGSAPSDLNSYRGRPPMPIPADAPALPVTQVQRAEPKPVDRASIDALKAALTPREEKIKTTTQSHIADRASIAALKEALTPREAKKPSEPISPLHSPFGRDPFFNASLAGNPNSARVTRQSNMAASLASFNSPGNNLSPNTSQPESFTERRVRLQTQEAQDFKKSSQGASTTEDPKSWAQRVASRSPRVLE